MPDNYEYKLSVVVIVYNTEYYLEECLDSLVNQTLDSMEIICVNDGSTDNSLNVLNKYAKKYDNIKVIDQENAGGANAGNRGLKEAKGEYVALVDSDDIVVEDAYEKMYNKAKETNSDIVGGKPNIYLLNYQRSVYYNHDIWDCEKTIKPDEYLDIYYDVFYWDKIYRRKLIEEHDIYMIPGKLYADAPMVFKAYFYANKITLIPDIVYYWRKRDLEAINEGDSYTSITKNLLDIDNMHDRLITYYYLKEYFNEAGKEKGFDDFIKLYLERFFYPINGIIKDENFKKTYLKELTPILEDIEDIYNNKLDIKYNLFIYFILNNQIDTLEEFINFYLDDRNIITENFKTYWNLKYLKNPKYNIPKELFEINSIYSRFIKIDRITVDEDYVYFQNIYVPGKIKIDEAYLTLIGLTIKGDSRNQNKIEFPLEIVNKNTFNAKLPITEIKTINVFDVYLRFKYEGKDDLIRVTNNHFKKIDKDNLTSNKLTIPFFSKLGNLSISNMNCKNIFEIKTNREKMTIINTTKSSINYKIFINFKRKNNRVYFTRDEEGEHKNIFELPWKYSLDKNIKYTLYLRIHQKNYKLTKDYFKNFEEKIIDSDVGEICLSEGKGNSVTLKL